MKTNYYKCLFLSDIVLPASSNTQGNIQRNDFIPGSNFLGMVAQGYEKFSEESFNVFHSGDIAFGDAHLAIHEQTTYKIPLSFHNIKTDSNTFYNRIHLSDTEEKELRNKQQQLKQIRNGFINLQGQMIAPEYTYTQKSSYDTEQRRSKESGMFGYSALQSGLEWIFKITYKDETFIDRVESLLLGEQKLGKSKSAQYGQVHISKVTAPQNLESFTPQDKLTYIYVNSRLALYDENGDFTVTPTIKNLGLQSGEIVWEKCYIKTSSYTPYNYKRQTQEYTRICINKGSIITLKNCTQTLPQRIGAFISEGFGEILVNPSFLEPEKPILAKYEQEPNKTQTSHQHDRSLIDFLHSKHEVEQAQFDLSSSVQIIYTDLIGPSKSQWGQIRTFASIAKSKEDLINKIEEFISHGVSKKQWETKKDHLIKAIEDSPMPLEFTKMLAMIVAKHTKGDKNDS